MAVPSIAPSQLTESGYKMSAKSPVVVLVEEHTNGNESTVILSSTT